MEPKNSDIIHTEAIYGIKHRKPFVVIKWGKEQAFFSPDEARRFALRILSTAEASVGDAFWWEFVEKDLKLGDQEAAALMVRFREWRLKTEEEH
jgi:hypothetical protein